MHVTASLAGHDVDVEVGEDCRSLQALKQCIVAALPQLFVEGFDVSVGGRALDDDSASSLEESVRLELMANTRGLGILALREAGREASGDGLLAAAAKGDMALCTLYLDAGVPIDYVHNPGAGDEWNDNTALHLACRNGHVQIARLLLDRGSTAIDARNYNASTPLHLACRNGSVSTVKLLLDRGSTSIDASNRQHNTPLHFSCLGGSVSVARLLLDRGSGTTKKNNCGNTPLHVACCNGRLEVVALLLDRGCKVEVERCRKSRFHDDVVVFLLEHGYDVAPPSAGRGVERSAT